MNLESLLKGVFTVLEEDYPDKFREVIDTAADRRMVVAVEGESVRISIQSVGRVRVTQIDGKRRTPADLRASMTRRAILDLLDGRAVVDELLEHDPDFSVSGDPDTLNDCMRAIEVVLSVATGSARMIELMRAFRYGGETPQYDKQKMWVVRGRGRSSKP